MGEHGVKERDKRSDEPEVGQGFPKGKVKNQSGEGSSGHTLPHEKELHEHHRGLEKEPKRQMGGMKKHHEESNHKEHDMMLHDAMPDHYRK